MNLNNYTIKAQETIQAAQQLAYTANNPTIETEHLLKALLSDKESPIIFLLKKNNVVIPLLETKLEEAINKLPQTQNGEPAQSVSREMNNVFLKANASLKNFGDEFISPEHFMLALLQVNDSTAKSLKDAGLTEKGLIAAIKDLRKGETIKSQTQETQFNVLNKYARNLNEAARQGN